MRILFTGGGSGGHIYPIIALKETLQQNNNGLELNFFYLGPKSPLDKSLIQVNIKTKFILAGKLRRYFSFLNLIDLFKIPLGLVQSLWHLFFIVPDVVFSKGGYGSLPVVLAAWLYRIPLIIHESDSAPGLANKIAAKLAKRIIISFPEALNYFPKEKTVRLGNPVRSEVIKGQAKRAQTLFKLNSNRPLVLIIGGSQGARALNELVINSLPRLLTKIEIIHLSGSKRFNKIKRTSTETLDKLTFEGQKYYHLYPFLEINELKDAYAASQLIVSRAGAGSISEIAACGKPALLIPLASAASNHQSKNAWAVAQKGGAVVLEEENLTINLFLETISSLLSKPEKLKELGLKIKAFFDPQTNLKIAQTILKLCPKK